MRDPGKAVRSLDVLSEVVELLDTTREDQKTVAGELQKGNKGGEKLLTCLVPWAGLYSLPMELLVLAFFELLGWGEKLKAACQAPNRVEAQIQLCQLALAESLDEETENHLDTLDDSALGIFMAVLFAMTSNATGIQRYGEPVSALVRKAEYDDESLFKAVAVDRSAVSHPTIAKRISIAQLKDDASFMDKLGKAITRTKPGRKVELDDFRYIVEVLDEVEGLQNLTIGEIAEKLVNGLGVYPDRVAGDAEEAIKKYLQLRRNRKGK